MIKYNFSLEAKGKQLIITSQAPKTKPDQRKSALDILSGTRRIDDFTTALETFKARHGDATPTIVHFVDSSDYRLGDESTHGQLKKAFPTLTHVAVKDLDSGSLAALAHVMPPHSGLRFMNVTDRSSGQTANLFLHGTLTACREAERTLAR